MVSAAARMVSQGGVRQRREKKIRLGAAEFHISYIPYCSITHGDNVDDDAGWGGASLFKNLSPSPKFSLSPPSYFKTLLSLDLENGGSG